MFIINKRTTIHFKREPDLSYDIFTLYIMLKINI